MPPLADGWEAAPAGPGSHPRPDGLDGLAWLPARVPGTAAGALRDAGLWAPGDARDFDAEDWWFRTRFAAEPAAAGEAVVLALDGLATLADVWLNGELVLASESMFVGHRVDVGGRLRGENELAIRFRALAPELAVPRKPRARWRTKVVADGTLRCFRTAILGRAPGFAPGPAPVGPWREVRLERRGGVTRDAVSLRPRLEGDDGVLAVLTGLSDPVVVELDGPSGRHEATIEPGGGELRVPGVARWWPHTHGEPVLHAVRVAGIDAGRVGFRTLAAGASPGHDVETSGLDLHVNGVRVFARGAVWTPADPVGLAAGPGELRAVLETVRDAGLNLVRLAGTGVYETDAFHALCDELGLLVWQDLMFANLDYPAADERFAALVETEVREVLDRVGGHPSTVVICGNSEVEQQVAMLGLDPALARSGLWEAPIPQLVGAAGLDAVWIPSAPTGGDLPFRPGAGVANYFGVGGYRLPLEDARRAEVRFASECLAFANVGEDDADALDGVPRDVGADWDFADVRDHYLEALFGVEALALRVADPARYLELSRAVTGEVMAEVFGEWRRAASPCGGGIVLWLRDLLPGSGWGLLDHRGRPKPVLAHLRRALAPVAVWTTDERLGGIAVHVANDAPAPLRARLRVTLYQGERAVEEAVEELDLPPHSVCRRDLEAMLGRFVDAAWAYRFGPPGHDAIVARLEPAGSGELERSGEPEGPAPSSGAHFRFPAGRPLAPLAPGELGLEGSAVARGDAVVLTVRSRRLAYGVRIHAPGSTLSDDAFSVEPGGERTVVVRGSDGPIELSALNLRGRIAVPA